MLGCGAGAAEAGGAGGSRSGEGVKSGCWVRRPACASGGGGGGPSRAPERRAGPRGDLGGQRDRFCAEKGNRR